MKKLRAAVIDTRIENEILKHCSKIHNQEAIKYRNEPDVMKLRAYPDKILTLESKGERVWVSSKHAQVLRTQFNLAEELRHVNLDMATSVLKRELPILKHKIMTLENEDVTSNVSYELDKLNDEKKKDRKACLIKVESWRYARMEEELTKQDKNEEMLRLEFNKLVRKNHTLKTQNT